MLSRWKILACSFTVGVGGLAVFATPPADTKKEPLPEPPPLIKLTVKPDSPPNGAETPAPPAGTKPGPGLEFDLDLPAVPVKAPDKPTSPAKIEIDLPVPPPPAIIPVKAETGDKKPADKNDDVKPKADTPVVPPIPDLTAPPPPVIPLTKPPVAPPPPAIPEIKTPAATPPPPVQSDDLKPIPLPEPTRASIPAPEPVRTPAPTAAPASKGEAARFKMLLRMGDGNPRFEIRNTATTELLLKVYGEKIELQSPAASKTSVAGVSATGKVRFTAPGIEGHCKSLKILSATGEVLLEGDIKLKSKGGKAWSELTAERMVYQIGNAGLVAPKPTVKPVGFSE